MSWGVIVRGAIVLGSNCPAGNYPGGNCLGGIYPVVIVQGAIVLEPIKTELKKTSNCIFNMEKVDLEEL